MVRDSALPTVIPCIPDTVAPVASDQLNSEMPVQKSVKQLLCGDGSVQHTAGPRFPFVHSLSTETGYSRA